MGELTDQPWGNTATRLVLILLWDAYKIDVPLRGSDIAIALNRRYVRPPSETTVYRALDKLEDEGFIESAEGGRKILTEDGVEIAQKYLDDEIEE